MDTEKSIGTVEPDPRVFEELVAPHLDSFNYFVERGLELAVQNIDAVVVRQSSPSAKLRIWLDNPTISPPDKEQSGGSFGALLLPHECRQAGLSYKGKFLVDVCFQFNENEALREQYLFGRIPIMLKSSLCHLRNHGPQKLVNFKEEANEVGGYFICNGYERLVRLLIVTKRNYPLAVQRNSFHNRGRQYTDKGVIARCIRADQSSVTTRLYYLQHGSANLGFSLRRREYLIPVGIILKALIDTNDHEIFLQLSSICSKDCQGEKGAVGTPFVSQRAMIILNEVRQYNIFTRIQCLTFIGERFKTALQGTETETAAAVGERLIKDYILVHLDSFSDKFNFLIFMLHKLFALVDGTAQPDSPDTLQNQEVLLPGHLLNIIIKEKLEEWLLKIKDNLQSNVNENKIDLQLMEQVKKSMEKVPASNVGRTVEAFINTGNLSSRSGLDLNQGAGFTVVAERLNFFRFLSHFRSVHRGSYFTTMRTTTVRKLLPESWGFLCPVHTPDGIPCGLLNHLTSNCRISTDMDSEGNIKDPLNIRKTIVNSLSNMGMVSALPRLICSGPPEYLSILLDGRVIGHIRNSKIPEAVEYLRSLKLIKGSGVPFDLEVGYIPISFNGQYPGLFLFTTPARFIRPVRNIVNACTGNSTIEYIAPFEQVYMEIKCIDGQDGGRQENGIPHTHEELDAMTMLSVVAGLTPWSDHNQSPRNMYQCQMAKQTIGFPAQSIQYRSDHKLYRLQTPQTPITRTVGYRKYHIDEYPSGTNAIVAVIAYTGYDMEDAMILNKSSVERGFCHGQIYETHTVDLTETTNRKDSTMKIFGRSKKDVCYSHLIDTDGLPYVGQSIASGEPFCSVIDTVTSKSSLHKLKGAEAGIVDYVAAVGTKIKDPMQKVSIRVRRGRNPQIGDKFSSRHGQKGVCSQLWPDIDMPFSAVTGMRPDIIFNPHGFPSRMTIGMILESIAAKAGSLKGQFVDATPFAKSLKDEGKESEESPIDVFGSILASHGFNYHGTEVLYGGTLGVELTCEIFIGPIYYQRLRHMVSDKFQVRATGPINPVTRQPIKGRKVGGGIRFGEMERDSVLAHGASYLLHDRLHTSSDYHVADVCSKCGNLLSTMFSPEKPKRDLLGDLPVPHNNMKKKFCKVCNSGQHVESVAMPYVFRYLAAELGAMNIKLALNIADAA